VAGGRSVGRSGGPGRSGRVDAGGRPACTRRSHHSGPAGPAQGRCAATSGSRVGSGWSDVTGRRRARIVAATSCAIGTSEASSLERWVSGPTSTVETAVGPNRLATSSTSPTSTPYRVTTGRSASTSARIATCPDSGSVTWSRSGATRASSGRATNAVIRPGRGRDAPSTSCRRVKRPLANAMPSASTARARASTSAASTPRTSASRSTTTSVSRSATRHSESPLPRTGPDGPRSAATRTSSPAVRAASTVPSVDPPSTTTTRSTMPSSVAARSTSAGIASTSSSAGTTSVRWVPSWASGGSGRGVESGPTPRRGAVAGTVVGPSTSPPVPVTGATSPIDVRSGTRGSTRRSARAPRSGTSATRRAAPRPG